MVPKANLRAIAVDPESSNLAHPPDAAAKDVAPRPSASIALTVDEPNGSALPGVLVGECVDPRHPTLQGRAKTRWTEPNGSSCERWVPVLMSVTVRANDRVLLVRPANLDEPVIVGVFDGFAARPTRPATGGPVLELQNDEAVRVLSSDGKELLELSLSESGPVVRLLGEDVGLSLPGKLSISADSIELRARQGEVTLSATDDVVLVGATVRLN
jgi:hypothetical protein